MDDDDILEGRNEEDNYVPQKEVDCVRHSKTGLEYDWLEKIRKIGSLDRSETKKSEGSAAKIAGEDNTIDVERGAQSEISTSQLRKFDDTTLLQVQAGYKDANVAVEYVDKQWIPNA